MPLMGVFLLMVSAANASGQTGSPARRPNILLAISDDQSYPHASAYGTKAIRTPAFDRVAREGVLFTQAFCASPGCSPSRAALLTGRYPWQLEHAGTHASSFSNKYTVYPDLLERAGYFVGYTGKPWGPGNWKAGGWSRNPAGPLFNDHRLRPPADGIRNTDYAENFKAFLAARPEGVPFCFWYGASEPHRRFEKSIGLASGKRLADVEVPPFLPDTPEVRSDILDYFYEIEWFDRHLDRMLAMLEEAGELDNTLVVVTSDNGMAFPRAKANVYEYGIHAPMAVRWPARVPGGRVVDDLVSFVDFAPTFLEVAGVSHEGSHAMVGRSLVNILTSPRQGRIDPRRTQVFSARERHSSSRYDNLGYPQRAIRTQDYLYIRNFRSGRWPAGAPQKFEANGSLGPPHGGYHDIDACPTLDFLIQTRHGATISPYFHWAVDKRPAEELYAIKIDPGCLNNLARSPNHAEAKRRLRTTLDKFLTDTNDPRVGENGDVFEAYKRYSRIRRFPPPTPTP